MLEMQKRLHFLELSLLFQIFQSILQGVAVFYLYCLRRENVRKLWLPKRFEKLRSSELNSKETLKTGETNKVIDQSEVTKTS